MLELQRIATGFGGNAVLHGIDLQVQAGEIAGLLGLNGAGKSVALKVVAGIQPAWSGRVLLGGQEITELDVEDRVRSGMGHITQGRQLFADMTVEENLRLGAYTLRETDPDRYPERLELMLERFPRLRERIRQRAGTMSGGEQAMLAVARALMSDPQLLLVDEPSAGLAPSIVGELFDLLRGINEDGVTILLVEQNIAFALDVVDTVHVLQRGRIVHSGARDELDRRELTEYLGVGRLLSASVGIADGAATSSLNGVAQPEAHDRPGDAMFTTSADGTRIHYEVVGTGDVPVILLHGLGDSTECWGPQVEALAEDARMLLVDVRGHGRSDAPDEGYSIAEMAADVEAAADAAGFEHAHVIGLSMGGAVAFEFALRAPERVASLVIVNSGPTARVGGLKGRALITLRKLLAMMLTPDKTAPAIAARLFPEPSQEALRDDLIHRISRNDPNAYRRSLFALARYHRAEEVRKLTMPTLFVHSEHDYTPLAWRQPFVDAMPNARLVQVDGAHHALPMERPDEFNAIIAGHLAAMAPSND